MNSFCVMLVFEAINQALHLKIWFSHMVTVLFATLGAAVLSFTVLRREERSKEMLQNSENKYRVLFEDSADPNWLMDEKGFLDCNSAALKMFGYSDVAHMNLANISPPTQPDGTPSLTAARERIAAAFLKGTERFEWLQQRKNGDLFPAEVCLTSLMLSGQPRLLATVRDVSDRKVAEERVQYLAYYDALTGLPNRTLLGDRLTKALADARRQKYKIALLFLDIDRFKDINDSLGHSVGDLFLQEVAERIKSFAREQDTVARLGGDEFLVMLTHIEDISDAAVAAERLMDAMTAEFVVEGHPLNVSCSVGISIFPQHGADGEALMKNADAAMYSVKENGRNNYRFFIEDMNAQVAERLSLENGLRKALDKNEFFLVYQPQMDIATKMITGLEALIRWQHPSLGLVPPDKFIGIAENSGLIVPIGEWVLRTACRQAKKWQDEGIPALSVAVNVSAVQFRQTGFCELIQRVLRETELDPQYLELELTESLLFAKADVTISVLKELKSMGLTLAIDDFGTGYSSLSYLKRFPVGKLKIDRSFVRDIAVNPDDAAITTAIISMAKSLNLKVVAEGVENEAQMSFLRAHQCDAVQGYYFGRPLAVEDVADKLRADYSEQRVQAFATGPSMGS
jgi:diguanylate cyclase (GGDEF)-like protein/PAS domain S-box-containing protein